MSGGAGGKTGRNGYIWVPAVVDVDGWEDVGSSGRHLCQQKGHQLSARVRNRTCAPPGRSPFSAPRLFCCSRSRLAVLGNAFSRSVTSQLRAEMYEARVWRSRGKEAEAGGEEGRDGERAEAGGRRRERGREAGGIGPEIT